MKKNITIIILIVLLFFLSGVAYKNWVAYDEIKQEYKLEKNNFKSEIDSLGKETVKIKGTLLSEKTLKETKIKELEKFKDDLKKAKNLVAYYQVNTLVRDTIKNILTVVEVDTVFLENGDYDLVKKKSFNYNDEWTNIKGEILIDSLKNESVTLNYSVDAGIEVLHKWKKNGFLKRKTPEVIVKFDNPNIRTQEVKTIIKRPKRKFFLFRWLGI